MVVSLKKKSNQRVSFFFHRRSFNWLSIDKWNYEPRERKKRVNVAICHKKSKRCKWFMAYIENCVLKLYQALWARTEKKLWRNNKRIIWTWMRKLANIVGNFLFISLRIITNNFLEKIIELSIILNLMKSIQNSIQMLCHTTNC